MKVAVPITMTDPTLQIPRYQTDGSAGFDLATAEDYRILPGAFTQVSTGIIVQTPPGHMLMLAARSSLYKRYNLILTNSVGIVDEDYAGEGDVVQLSLKSENPNPIMLLKGERIAQGVFVPITRAQFQVSKARAQQRGGWGSTG